jgi:NhaA family Na+:H+ antiporter
MTDPNSPDTHTSALPEEPIDRILGPFARFLHVEATGGVLLLACAALALALANSPASEAYLAFWKTPIGFRIGGFEMIHSLKHWINDGLMVIFFFVIGLEVKRELVLGELRDTRRAALPVVAALGGMVVPASVYLILQAGEPGVRGWGIPMATDIAFVVGCLALLGSRVPRPLRVLLLSLAIADDIGAILVIAIGYTSKLEIAWLVAAFAGLGLARILSHLGVRAIGVYVVVGVGVWLAFHESGVHATLAGVLLGLLTPTSAWVAASQLDFSAERVRRYLHGETWQSSGQRRTAMRELSTAASESLSPLERIEIELHPWSSFAIMPIFALANAGVPLQTAALGDPVAVAIMAGLLLGKPIGIVAFSFAAIRAGLAQLPEGVTWPVMVGAGLLAGIGFTMALFIAGLALEGPMLDAAKIGILAASLLAAIAGMLLLRFSLRPLAAEPGS